MKTRQQISDKCESLKEEIQKLTSNMDLGWNTDVNYQEHQRQVIKLLQAKLNALLWVFSND